MAQYMKENIKIIKSMEEDLILGVKALSKVMFMKANGKKTDSLNSSVNCSLLLFMYATGGKNVLIIYII